MARPHNDRRRRVLSRAMPDGVGGRAVWMTLALLFLCLVALAIWLFVRTVAPFGTGATPEVRQILEVTEEERMTQQDHAPVETVGGEGKVSLSALPTGSVTGGEGTPADVPPTSQETDSEDRDEGNIVYYRHKNDRMEIALSFDDGPHPRYTPEILEILAEYDVKATFFMVGENVTFYPEAAEAVLAAGHEIGNHTYSHRRLKGLSEGDIRQEILRGEEAIASLGECRPRLLRPPEGSMNTNLRRLSSELDYRLILWDIDTKDWAHTPPDVICQKILDTVQAGDIILMHDFIGKNSPTPAALRRVIPALLERGYHFVTVSALIDG